MPLGYFQALGILRRSFAPHSAGQRLHILIRFLTCPFTRTIDDVPPGVRVLEIGAGHGAFAALLTEERVPLVYAVDPDVRKGVLPSPSPRVKKIIGFDECVRGTFGAVVLYDVLYRMPVEVQKALFLRIFDRLEPGGRVVVKEMDPARRWKMQWTRFQEWLNERLLGLTLGEGVVTMSRAETEAMLRHAGFTGITARAIDRGYPHPHIIYTAVKPAA